MSSPARRPLAGFTLIELLISVSVLALLVVLLSSLLGGMNKAWVAGEQRVETYQSGRAIVDLIARDLKSAVISPKLQFIQNPAVSTQWRQRTNSSSLFWQAALQSGPAGNVCEVGYYLDDTYRLQRFYVPPDDPNYSIYATAPSTTGATWVTNYDPVAKPGLFSPVSNGVLGLWIRCLDRNGDPIPWYQAPIFYNSAASFQPATPGGAFKYTSAGTTAAANLLPYFAEITIVTLDSKTLNRPGARIPGIPQDTSDPSSPTVNGPQDIPAAIRYFETKLVTNNIKSAHTFSARVRLENASL